MKTLPKEMTWLKYLPVLFKESASLDLTRREVAMDGLKSMAGYADEVAELRVQRDALLREAKAVEQLIKDNGFYGNVESKDRGFHIEMVPISVERAESLRTAINKAEGKS